MNCERRTVQLPSSDAPDIVRIAEAQTTATSTSTSTANLPPLPANPAIRESAVHTEQGFPQAPPQRQPQPWALRGRPPRTPPRSHSVTRTPFWPGLAACWAARGGLLLHLTAFSFISARCLPLAGHADPSASDRLRGVRSDSPSSLLSLLGRGMPSLHPPSTWGWRQGPQAGLPRYWFPFLTCFPGVFFFFSFFFLLFIPDAG